MGVTFGGKLDDDEPLRLPVALDNVHFASPDNVLALVFFHEAGGKSDVFLVLLRIVDGYVDNNVCTHIGSPSILEVAWRYNSQALVLLQIQDT